MLEDTWNDIIKFNDKHFPNWRKEHYVFLSNALAGETGEICNLTKKMAGGGTNTFKVSEPMVAHECVDLYIYLVLLMENLGIDIHLFEHYFNEKMMVLNKRMENKKC